MPRDTNVVARDFTGEFVEMAEFGEIGCAVQSPVARPRVRDDLPMSRNPVPGVAGLRQRGATTLHLGTLGITEDG